MLSLFVAQRTLCGCEMTKAMRFRKEKSGRKLCKTGGSQLMTLSLNMVLLNGGEVWEQGNQEGVLVPLLLLAEAVAEIPVEAVAISPLRAAHGNHRAGPRQPGRILEEHKKHLLPHLLLDHSSYIICREFCHYLHCGICNAIRFELQVERCHCPSDHKR